MRLLRQRPSPPARSATRSSAGSTKAALRTSSCSTTTSTSLVCSSAARCMSRSSAAFFLALAASFVPSASAAPQPLSKLVGQTIMTGFHGTHPSAGLLARIRAGQVGGVILFRPNIAGEGAARTLIARLQAAARAGGNPKLLVAVDQEGGSVRRFVEGPPDESQPQIETIAEARSEGAAAGRFLRGVGIDVDLAPVLDTPASAGNFMHFRAYSGNAGWNGSLGVAFIDALQSKRVAATAKHFPGLGRAPANTDSSHVWITAPKAKLDVGLRPFAKAIKAGVDLVMVSNAGYRAYDPSGLPAVLSHRIVTGVLRDRLGFDGVVISDSMGAPGPSAHGDAATMALRAGTDVVLYLRETDSARAYAEVLASVRSGRLSRAALRDADERIAALKTKIG